MLGWSYAKSGILIALYRNYTPKMPKIHKLSQLNIPEGFSKPARALKIAIASGGIVAKILAQKTGIREQTLSEFLSGKRDGLYTRSLEALVDNLPRELRILFFQEWMGEAVPQRQETLPEMIERLDPNSQADRDQAAAAFRLIAEKFVYPSLDRNGLDSSGNTDERRELASLKSP